MKKIIVIILILILIGVLALEVSTLTKMIKLNDALPNIEQHMPNK